MSSGVHSRGDLRLHSITSSWSLVVRVVAHPRPSFLGRFAAKTAAASALPQVPRSPNSVGLPSSYLPPGPQSFVAVRCGVGTRVAVTMAQSGVTVNSQGTYTDFPLTFPLSPSMNCPGLLFSSAARFPQHDIMATSREPHQHHSQQRLLGTPESLKRVACTAGGRRRHRPRDELHPALLAMHL